MGSWMSGHCKLKVVDSQVIDKSSHNECIGLTQTALIA